MNYRIKIITYKSGKQEFYPQVKKGFFWIGLYYDGEASVFARDSYRNTRASALESIDLHNKGNHKKQTIKFEYINK